MKSKMTKKRYIEFYAVLTGHSKSFVEKNMRKDTNDNYEFVSGMQRYSAWLIDGKIYCQHFLDNQSQRAWWFDFDSFEFDFKRTEQDEKDEIERIIFERKENGYI